MAKFTECRFENQKVRIDNNQYHNCTFEKCVIEYGAAGPITLDSCVFNSCQWALVDEARNTMHFLHTMYHHMGDFGKKMVDATFENIKKSPPPIPHPTQSNLKK